MAGIDKLGLFPNSKMAGVAKLGQSRFRSLDTAAGAMTLGVEPLAGVDVPAQFPNSKMADAVKLGTSQFISGDVAASGGGSSTDPSLSSVVFLAGWEGANGATTYSEEKNAAVGTFSSGSRISTLTAKFGTSCFDFNGGYINFPDSNNWVLSSGNADQFCIEMWLLSTSAAPGDRCIIGQDFGAGAHAFYLHTTAANELEFLADPNQTNYVSWLITSGVTWAINTWTHIAVTKDATGKVRIFKDGVMKGSATPANSAISNAGTTLNFGWRLGGAPWLGYMDETRITKGAARYASDTSFTPPTAAFPRS